MKDHYAVIGNPIEHSKSPLIQSYFANETQQFMDYTTLLSPLDGFEQTVRQFFQQHGKGLNVTVPFKLEAWNLCDELSDYAQQAGAVNTLFYQDDGRIYGANTDGLGIVRDLMVNNGVTLQGKRILILGAGGAVRGILQPIMQQQPEQVFIANRTAAKAEKLVEHFASFQSVISTLNGGGYEEIPLQSFDLIINGTAASLNGMLPPIPVECCQNMQCCYDMMYSDKPTPFVQWGRDNHAVLALDGLGMLIEQAAESFQLWRGIRPNTAPVFHLLRP
ncbi:MAG TPA: shikimate dehydrogenase [Thiothrix sp.]|nr:shikimate dehydrogenase [Thiothrix sp.]